jgi:hypothetical protein
MSYLVNNLKFLLEELGDEPTTDNEDSGFGEDPLDSSSEEESEDGLGGLGLDDEESEDGLGLDDESSGDDEFDPEEAASELEDQLDDTEDTLENVLNVISPISFMESNDSIHKVLKNKSMKNSYISEGPWDSMEKKSEEFKEKIDAIKKPYQAFFDAKKNFKVEDVAQKAAKTFINFDSLIDKYEIVKYFASIEIALHGPESQEELSKVLEEFEYKLQDLIKESGTELANSEYTIDNNNHKTAVGATSSGGA